MQLSKTSYYADFGVYAGLIVLLTGVAAFTGSWLDKLKWLGALAAGVAVWTLIEYLLHRFGFHGRGLFAPLHARHHLSPRAFIGTPTWLSLTIIVLGIFVPIWGIASPNVASGVAAGVMLGFFVYGLMHHAIHHRRPRVIFARLGTATRRHLQHHHAARGGNYGVTTSLWDCIFGTELDRPPVRATAAAQN